MGCVRLAVSVLFPAVVVRITTANRSGGHLITGLLANGEISAGVAIEDWVGIHYKGTEIHQVIGAKPGARAYSMRSVYGSVQEVPLPVEYLAQASE